MHRVALESGRLYRVKWAFDVPTPPRSKSGPGTRRLLDSRIISRDTHVLALNEESSPKFAKDKAGSWVLWNELKLWVPEDKYMYLQMVK